MIESYAAESTCMDATRGRAQSKDLCQEAVMNQSTPVSNGVHPNCLPISIGGDLGDRKSDLCVLGPSGEILQETRIPTTPVGMETFFGRIEPCRVA